MASRTTVGFFSWSLNCPVQCWKSQLPMHPWKPLTAFIDSIRRRSSSVGFRKYSVPNWMMTWPKHASNNSIAADDDKSSSRASYGSPCRIRKAETILIFVCIFLFRSHLSACWTIHVHLSHQIYAQPMHLACRNDIQSRSCCRMIPLWSSCGRNAPFPPSSCAFFWSASHNRATPSLLDSPLVVVVGQPHTRRRYQCNYFVEFVVIFRSRSPLHAYRGGRGGRGG